MFERQRLQRRPFDNQETHTAPSLLQPRPFEDEETEAANAPSLEDMNRRSAALPPPRFTIWPTDPPRRHPAYGTIQRQAEEGEEEELQRQPENGTMQRKAGNEGYRNEPARRFPNSQTDQPWLIPGYAAKLQAKLTIGAVDDPYEQEADRVAEQVVDQIQASATAQPSQRQTIQRQEEMEEELQAKPEITTLQRQEEMDAEELQAKPEITTLQRQEEMDEDELQAKPEITTLQRQEGRDATGEAAPDLESAINSARGSGQPLEDGLQRSMGQAMGADFSGVRIHTNTQADQLNQSIQAKAFTTGQDVFFRQGEYQPGHQGGQKLIAHELTHVVQQNPRDVRRSSLSPQLLSQHPATRTPSDTVGDCAIQLKGDRVGQYRKASVPQDSNQTSTSEDIKSNVEALSSISIDKTSFHYNSSQSTQISELNHAPTLQLLSDAAAVRVKTSATEKPITMKGSELPQRVYVYILGKGIMKLHKKDISDDGTKTAMEEGKNDDIAGFYLKEPSWKADWNDWYGANAKSGESSDEAETVEKSGEKEGDETSEESLDNSSQSSESSGEAETVEGQGEEGETIATEEEWEPKLIPEVSDEPTYSKVIGKAFIGKPKATDVKQGIGDCYFMATLASLIDTEHGAGLIKQMITESADGLSYTVRFADIKEGDFTLSGEVFVTAWFPTRMGRFVYALAGRHRADAIYEGAEVALWPAILEKAYAVHRDRRATLKDQLSPASAENPDQLSSANAAMKAMGDYELLRGGRTYEAMRDIGVAVEEYRNDEPTADDVQTWIANRWSEAIVAGTPVNPVQWVCAADFTKESEENRDYQLYTAQLHQSQRYNGRKGKIEIADDDGVKATGNFETVVQSATDREFKIWVNKTTQLEQTGSVRIWVELDFASKGLQQRHAFMVKKRYESGVVLWDQERSEEVKVSYDDLCSYGFVLTAGVSGANGANGEKISKKIRFDRDIAIEEFYRTLRNRRLQDRDIRQWMIIIKDQWDALSKAAKEEVLSDPTMGGKLRLFSSMMRESFPDIEKE